MTRKIRIEPYDGPAGGWGSMRSVTKYLGQESMVLSGPAILSKQNKPDGFMCVSCAWGKPADPHPAEFCENGAKATVWELTPKRVTPEFFAQHTLSELKTWADHDLEDQGRLTEPMKYDAALDKYVPVKWEAAFAEIGAELKALREVDPKSAVFYASGRASLETSYMYALLARLYGNNNLPDSSNMCHESTSVGLKESIGVAVGTIFLEDFDKADAMFFFGQNVGSNSPRFLHDLKAASERGCRIVTFNPLRERGLERFTNPQDPVQMMTRQSTPISSQYYQVRAGGDIAVMMGMAKVVIAADDEAQASGRPRVLDVDFIEQHTHGFDDFIQMVRNTEWSEIERESGLPRADIERAGQAYVASKNVIGVYGMGLTQHKLGVDNVQMFVNLLLLRGNIGRPGAGICPVRGHSNVQGQRTVGIADNPALVPLDRLAEQYGFEPPRDHGLTTVTTCEGVINGSVRAFVGLGGNFLRAVPDNDRLESYWPKLRLTVQIATKLNRSHLINGEVAYLLPCLGRIEIDRQASGQQVVTIEDSLSHFHASRGMTEPASKRLLSEPKIVAEIAKATLPPNPKIDWDKWVGDYSLVRNSIEETYPKIFKGFNQRMHTPGGFPKPLAARERKWETKTGKANFMLPRALHASFDKGDDPEVLRLITLRSNDQFNTTIYGYHDRFRGIEGTRMVVFLSEKDIRRFGLSDGETVTLEAVTDDNIVRRVSGLRVVSYSIPEGCIGAYYPECNPLIPLWQYAERSKVPAAKSVPVRILRGSQLAAAAE